MTIDILHQPQKDVAAEFHPQKRLVQVFGFEEYGPRTKMKPSLGPIIIWFVLLWLRVDEKGGFEWEEVDLVVLKVEQVETLIRSFDAAVRLEHIFK